MKNASSFNVCCFLWSLQWSSSCGISTIECLQTHFLSLFTYSSTRQQTLPWTCSFSFNFNLTLLIEKCKFYKENLKILCNYNKIMKIWTDFSEFRKRYFMLYKFKWPCIRRRIPAAAGNGNQINVGTFVRRTATAATVRNNVP